MERSFKEEVGKLQLGDGDICHGEGILAVTKALHQAEINIHYVYPFVCRPLDHGALALSVEDNDLASTVLSSLGLKVLTQRDIAR